MTVDQSEFLPRHDFENIQRHELTKSERATRQRLKRAGHELRKVQHAFEPKSATAQVTSAREVIERFVDPTTRDQYLDMLMAGEQILSPDDLQGIPEFARIRMLSRHADKAAELWPWIAVVETPRLVDDYLKIYRELAGSLGLLAEKPAISTVPDQRHIRFEDRALAQQFDFVQDMIASGSHIEAGKRLLASVVSERDGYLEHGRDILRHTVSEKIAREDTIAGIRGSRMWNDKEALAMMSTNRGKRDALIGNYGVMRSITGEGASGYGIGQEVMAYRVALRQAVRTY